MRCKQNFEDSSAFQFLIFFLRRFISKDIVLLRKDSEIFMRSLALAYGLVDYTLQIHSLLGNSESFTSSRNQAAGVTWQLHIYLISPSPPTTEKKPAHISTYQHTRRDFDGDGILFSRGSVIFLYPPQINKEVFFSFYESSWTHKNILHPTPKAFSCLWCILTVNVHKIRTLCRKSIYMYTLHHITLELNAYEKREK